MFIANKYSLLGGGFFYYLTETNIMEKDSGNEHGVMTGDETVDGCAPDNKTDYAFGKARRDSITALHEFMNGFQGCDGSGLNAFGEGRSEFPAEEVEEVGGGHEEIADHEMENNKFPHPPLLPGELRF